MGFCVTEMAEGAETEETEDTGQDQHGGTGPLSFSEPANGCEKANLGLQCGTSPDQKSSVPRASVFIPSRVLRKLRHPELMRELPCL